MGCSSHSGWVIPPSSNLIPLLIWLSILPILFVVIWVFMETLPMEKEHGMCLQIYSKGKFKKKIGEEQDGTKDRGTFFF